MTRTSACSPLFNPQESSSSESEDEAAAHRRRARGASSGGSGSGSGSGSGGGSGEEDDSSGGGGGGSGSGSDSSDGDGDSDAGWMSDAESVGSDEVSKLCREAGDLACFDEADDDGGGGAGAGAEVSERLSILVAVFSLFSVLGTLFSVKTTTAARWAVSFQPRVVRHAPAAS